MKDLYNMKLYVTNSCNLLCKHCWIDAKYGEKDNISVEQIKNIVGQGVALGLKSVAITGGEPTLRSDLLEILDVMHEAGVSVNMETNGLLLNDKIIDKLHKMNANVSVSLDGPNEQVHEWLRGVKGSFDRALMAVKALTAKGIKVEVIMVLHKKNMHLVKEMIELCTAIGANNLKINHINKIGRAQEDDFNQYILSASEIYAFTKHFEEAIKPNCPLKVKIDLPCSFFSLQSINEGHGYSGCGIKNLISILSTGEITICGGGYYYQDWIMGHIDRDKLEDIWEQSPLLADIRENLPDKLEGVCQKCMFKMKCRGACRAFAMSTYQSIYAPLPVCQGLYEEGKFPQTRLIMD